MNEPEPTKLPSATNEERSAVRSGALLEALRVRFPKARFHFSPASDCKRCGGGGVEPARTMPSGRRLNEGPCACLFFGPDTTLGVKLVAEAAGRLGASNDDSTTNR
jgi:hypothetical protein